MAKYPIQGHVEGQVYIYIDCRHNANACAVIQKSDLFWRSKVKITCTCVTRQTLQWSITTVIVCLSWRWQVKATLPSLELPVSAQTITWTSFHHCLYNFTKHLIHQIQKPEILVIVKVKVMYKMQSCTIFVDLFNLLFKSSHTLITYIG